MPVININSDELRQMIKNEKDNLEIIDVREAEEYAIISIRGSKLILFSDLEKNIDEIDWNKKVVFICRSGSRSRAAAEMATEGKEAFSLSGGIAEYYFSGDKNDLEIDESKIGDYL